MKDYGTEQVLVVPVEYLKKEGLYFEGIRRSGNPWFDILDEAFFFDRTQAETDERFLQIIPYVVFVSGEDVLVYERGITGGEKRLVGMKSIGIGGHCSLMQDGKPAVVAATPEAVPGGAPAQYGLSFMREIVEELGESALAYCAGALRPTALIHDRSNAVSRVHIGLCHVIRTPEPLDLTDTEVCIKNPKYTPTETLNHDELEVWSQLALEAVHWEEKK